MDNSDLALDFEDKLEPGTAGTDQAIKSSLDATAACQLHSGAHRGAALAEPQSPSWHPSRVSSGPEPVPAAGDQNRVFERHRAMAQAQVDAAASKASASSKAGAVTGRVVAVMQAPIGQNSPNASSSYPHGLISPEQLAVHRTVEVQNEAVLKCQSSGAVDLTDHHLLNLSCDSLPPGNPNADLAPTMPGDQMQRLLTSYVSPPHSPSHHGAHFASCVNPGCIQSNAATPSKGEGHFNPSVETSMIGQYTAPSRCAEQAASFVHHSKGREWVPVESLAETSGNMTRLATYQLDGQQPHISQHGISMGAAPYLYSRQQNASQYDIHSGVGSQQAVSQHLIGTGLEPRNLNAQQAVSQCSAKMSVPQSGVSAAAQRAAFNQHQLTQHAAAHPAVNKTVRTTLADNFSPAPLITPTQHLDSRPYGSPYQAAPQPPARALFDTSAPVSALPYWMAGVNESPTMQVHSASRTTAQGAPWQAKPATEEAHYPTHHSTAQMCTPDGITPAQTFSPHGGHCSGGTMYQERYSMGRPSTDHGSISHPSFTLQGHHYGGAVITPPDQNRMCVIQSDAARNSQPVLTTGHYDKGVARQPQQEYSPISMLPGSVGTPQSAASRDASYDHSTMQVQHVYDVARQTQPGTLATLAATDAASRYHRSMARSPPGGPVTSGSQSYDTMLYSPGANQQFDMHRTAIQPFDQPPWVQAGVASQGPQSRPQAVTNLGQFTATVQFPQPVWPVRQPPPTPAMQPRAGRWWEHPTGVHGIQEGLQPDATALLTHLHNDVSCGLQSGATGFSTDLHNDVSCGLQSGATALPTHLHNDVSYGIQSGATGFPSHPHNDVSYGLHSGAAALHRHPHNDVSYGLQSGATALHTHPHHDVSYGLQSGAATRHTHPHNDVSYRLQSGATALHTHPHHDVSHTLQSGAAALPTNLHKAANSAAHSPDMCSPPRTASGFTLSAHPNLQGQAAPSRLSTVSSTAEQSQFFPHSIAAGMPRSSTGRPDPFIVSPHRSSLLAEHMLHSGQGSSPAMQDSSNAGPSAVQVAHHELGSFVLPWHVAGIVVDQFHKWWSDEPLVKWREGLLHQQEELYQVARPHFDNAMRQAKQVHLSGLRLILLSPIHLTGWIITSPIRMTRLALHCTMFGYQLVYCGALAPWQLLLSAQVMIPAAVDVATRIIVLGSTLPMMAASSLLQAAQGHGMRLAIITLQGPVLMMQLLVMSPMTLLQRAANTAATGLKVVAYMQAITLLGAVQVAWRLQGLMSRWLLHIWGRSSGILLLWHLTISQQVLQTVAESQLLLGVPTIPSVQPCQMEATNTIITVPYASGTMAGHAAQATLPTDSDEAAVRWVALVAERLMLKICAYMAATAGALQHQLLTNNTDAVSAALQGWQQICKAYSDYCLAAIGRNVDDSRQPPAAATAPTTAPDMLEPLKIQDKMFLRAGQAVPFIGAQSATQQLSTQGQSQQMLTVLDWNHASSLLEAVAGQMQQQAVSMTAALVSSCNQPLVDLGVYLLTSFLRLLLMLLILTSLGVSSLFKLGMRHLGLLPPPIDPHAATCSAPQHAEDQSQNFAHAAQGPTSSITPMSASNHHHAELLIQRLITLEGRQFPTTPDSSPAVGLLGRAVTRMVLGTPSTPGSRLSRHIVSHSLSNLAAWIEPTTDGQSVL